MCWINRFKVLVLLLFVQLVWLNPDSNHELLWDYGMCAGTSRGAAVRDLIAKALKGPLAPAQQEVCFPSVLVWQLFISLRFFNSGWMLSHDKKFSPCVWNWNLYLRNKTHCEACALHLRLSIGVQHILDINTLSILWRLTNRVVCHIFHMFF